MPLEPVKGATVEIPSAGRGIVRFAGSTQFSAGKWIGIELAEQRGKNDGSVQGVTYFNCRMGYGVFVRPSQVKVLEAPKNTEPNLNASTSTRPPPSSARLGHQRQSSINLNVPRAPSVRSVQSGQSVSSRAASPAKPTVPSTSARVASSRLTAASPTKRLSQVGPRKSVLASPDGSARSSPTIAAVTSPFAKPATPQQPQPQPPQPPQPPPPRIASPPPPPPPPQPVEPIPIPVEEDEPEPDEEQPSQEVTESQLESTLRAASPRNTREEQELRARLRVMEAKRDDDVRRIRELESRLAEAENFVSIRPKLQAKLTSLQSDLISTRRSLADAESLSSMSEMRLLEANEQLEMALLDKEVAEERAEAAESELETLKEQLAIVEVELGVLKEGGDDDDDGEGGGDGGGGGAGGAGGAKEKLAFIQLEKQNERLKEALIRLRDISAETDAENRRKLSELEKDLATIDELQADYESNLKKLFTAESQVEDLKQQLDDALGAEEMLVQLTERNLELGEKIEEMRLAIEELEMLKEIADELEEQHMETEKALQEDLDAKEVEVHEQNNKIKELQNSLEDYEGTIAQFRDLVLQLQSDLDTLRTESQSAQTESLTQASKASQIMSMNLKLQSNISKSQAKTIDLELRKLEAREAREFLSIVQPYLPQVYVETDSDATSCYLFFQRLGAKTDLINVVVGQTYGLPDSLNGPVSDSLVGVCEMRGRISHLSTLAKRFAAVMRRCDVETFLNAGRIYAEIAPMEKRIDIHIDLLKREEFRTLECVSDVTKILAQFEHLAETYFSGVDYDLGERELDHASQVDSDLDMFAAAIGLTKTAIQTIQKDDEVVVEWGDSDTEVIEPLQRLLDQCRGAKQLSKKVVKRIEDLLNESSALKPNLVPQLNSLTIIISKGVDFAIQLAQSVNGYLADVRAAKHPYQLGGVMTLVREIATATMSRKDVSLPSFNDVSDCLLQLVQDISALLPVAMESESTTKITGIPPWVHRVEEVKAVLAVNVEAERKVAQLNEEMQDLVRGLKTRDQTLQESAVRIELMERRMEAVKKQADTITDLEAELSKARKQERSYEEAIEQLQADLDILEQDNARLKVAAPGPERQTSVAPQGDAEPVAVEGTLETSHLLEQIEALRGAVRFLRNENSYLKGYDLLKELQSLPPLPSMTRPPTPPLDRSDTPSTDADSESDAEEEGRPRSLRTLATETKLLYRDVIQFSSTRKVIDLSALNKQRMEKNSHAWMPKKQTPAHQVWERKQEGERLGRRVKGLLERAQGIGVVRVL
ncbi:hypothetical protein M422DRAFT_26769 [Sphaerobolus stellatus SS14]|nr:hypothetical protein M422DRAFT_26769 [Sphaerobolus stellatus SS14]